MRLFLDTAHVEDVKRLVEIMPIIEGVTTNPSHLSKESGHPLQVVQDLCDIFADKGLVCVQVTQSEPTKAYEEAQRISDIARNVVVKIPCLPSFYPVIEKLVTNGISVNATLVFSISQAVFMSKLGVDIVSPFVGRLDDDGKNGIELVAALRHILDGHGRGTQILAASIRTVERFEQAILAGAHIISVPVAVCEQAMKHPLSEKGFAQFEADWKAYGKPLI